MNVSKHCLTRQQQRAIPKIVMHWLIEFGAERKAPGGVIELYFDRQSIKRMNSELGSQIVSLCSKYLKVRLIEAPTGTIVTTYWKH